MKIISLFSRLLAIWQEDNLLRRVVRNSSYLFSSTTIGMGLATVQSVLAARLLGVATFGLLGMVMSFATSINRLLSFRIGELVVKYGGEYLAKNEKERAAATIKGAALLELGTSFTAYSLLFILAPLASEYIIKDPSATIFIRYYSLALLANFSTGTATAVLQIGDRFRSQALLGLIQNVLSASIITFAYFTDGDIGLVLIAYSVGKTFYGMSFLILGLRRANQLLGNHWWRNSQWKLLPLLEMSKFALSSNLSATAILVFRESEILWVGYFLSTVEAGYFKAAYALIGLIALPINPLIATVYPEINRIVAEKAWPRLKNFLKKVTIISGTYNLTVIVGIVFFGKWLLGIYGEQYVVAYPALLVLLVGMVFNYTLFWNRPLLLSLGFPTFPLKAILIAGLAKIGMAFIFVPHFGYIAEAALLSFYYITSVGLIVWRGMKEIRIQERVST